MSDVDLPKLKKLFQEKRYSEIILNVEGSTTESNRTPALYNLLGICRVSQKARSKRDSD